LQTEFADQGLLVIAANGFDDEQSKIAEFVSDCEVDYQILMNAATVARDQYYVSGFPTTFWIDQDGKIVKRLTGFDENEFETMRKQLIELLPAKQSRD
jgi:hypothetical protein